jgi:hypothetical protein
MGDPPSDHMFHVSKTGWEEPIDKRQLCTPCQYDSLEDPRGPDSRIGGRSYTVSWSSKGKVQTGFYFVFPVISGKNDPTPVFCRYPIPEELNTRDISTHETHICLRRKDTR